MVGGISGSLSALNAFQTKLDVTAENLSNINTDGYKAKRVTMAADGLTGGVTATVDTDDRQGPLTLKSAGGKEETVETSNVDLAGSMVDLITAQRGMEANLAVVKTQDQVTGTLLDIKR